MDGPIDVIIVPRCEGQASMGGRHSEGRHLYCLGDMDKMRAAGLRAWLLVKSGDFSAGLSAPHFTNTTKNKFPFFTLFFQMISEVLRNISFHLSDN